MFGPLPRLRTLEASVRDLASQRAETRASAASDLARHAADDGGVRGRALPLLEARLVDDDDGRVRAAAAVALGDLKAREALPRLLTAANDDDGYVRQMALNALGEIGDARALGHLTRALGDSRPEVRYQAVIAFARVAENGSDIDDAIVRAANDADDAVVHIALRVAEERIDEGKGVGALVIAQAKALIEHASLDVKLVAAIMLAKIGDRAGDAVILGVVRGGASNGRPPEKEDECAAVEVTGAIGMKEAVPALERRAWGIASHFRDTCKFHAKIALARMGHARAKAEILHDLGSSRRDALLSAVVAAGRARLEEARGALLKLQGTSADPALVRHALAELDSCKGHAS